VDDPEESARPKNKRRQTSPPPRVLPKRSLAEILRAGAAGLDASEDPASQASTANPPRQISQEL
jgi:hypothetical protein